MKLYGFPLSAYTRKVAVTLAEKGLEFDWEPTNPGQPSEEFLTISPFSKIPGFADGDYKLADSSAIIAYLDAKYPEPALIPAQAEARGRAIWLDEAVDTVLIPAGAPIVHQRFLYPVVFGKPGDEALAVAAEEAILKPLDYFEGALGADGWLNGEFSIGDIALAAALKTVSYGGWTVDSARHPKLAGWQARVHDRASWQQIADREASIFASLKG